MSQDSSNNENLTDAAPRKTLAVWLATGFGIGLVTPAPGTFGTLIGLPLVVGVALLPNIGLQVLAIAVLFIIGIPICTKAANDLGGKKDPGSIVFDEIASLPIVFLFAPMEWLSTKPLATAWPILLVGFLLHRVFDISKPPPIKRFEKLPDGLGVMADDTIAALYACAVFQLLLMVWGKFQ